jgi:hypothetical protein
VHSRYIRVAFAIALHSRCIRVAFASHSLRIRVAFSLLFLHSLCICVAFLLHSLHNRYAIALHSNILLCTLCIRFAFAVHSLCIRCAFALLSRCIRNRFAFALHSLCIRVAFAIALYSRYILYSSYLKSLCIRCAFAPHSLCIRIVFRVAFSLHALHSLYMLCIRFTIVLQSIIITSTSAPNFTLVFSPYLHEAVRCSDEHDLVRVSGLSDASQLLSTAHACYPTADDDEARNLRHDNLLMNRRSFARI